jgi:hypothetical protein
VTEAQWLACENPLTMIRALRQRVGERKWRLFCCALCRWGWERLADPRARRAVEVAERFADGLAAEEELRAARDATQQLQSEHTRARREGAAAGPAGWISAAQHAVMRVPQPQAAVSTLWPDLLEGESPAARQARRRARDRALLYDILGLLPFRPASFSPQWRTDTALALARQMYDSRDFGAMPILADALQEAGCDSEDILAHCRGDGPHVRGCWVIDLVLGKE